MTERQTCTNLAWYDVAARSIDLHDSRHELQIGKQPSPPATSLVLTRYKDGEMASQRLMKTAEYGVAIPDAKFAAVVTTIA